jgi:hypothetical protein
MPSKQSEAVKKHWTAARLAADLPDHEPADIESSNDAWGSLTAEPRGVDYLETAAGGLPAMWAVPKHSAEDRVLLCMHGGGWCLEAAPESQCATPPCGWRINLGTNVTLGSVDGLELQERTLYAVRNTNMVTIVRLDSQLAAGTVLGDITDPDLDVPTTATVAGRLWVANARLGTMPPPPDKEYWITQLPLRPENG